MNQETSEYLVNLKVSLHTFDFCFNFNYRGIIMNYKCVAPAYHQIIIFVIFYNFCIGPVYNVAIIQE